ncbi:MAG: hypothetical protein ACREU7_12290 [Burkholderiales bacterium]
MRNLEARAGAALAGAMLICLPAIELLWGRGMPGAAHAITAIFGVALLASSAAGARP